MVLKNHSFFEEKLNLAFSFPVLHDSYTLFLEEKKKLINFERRKGKRKKKRKGQFGF